MEKKWLSLWVLERDLGSPWNQKRSVPTRLNLLLQILLIVVVHLGIRSPSSFHFSLYFHHNESHVKVLQLLIGFCEVSLFILLLSFLLFVCFSLQVRLSWYTVAIAALSPKEMLLKTLGLLLYLS